MAHTALAVTQVYLCSVALRRHILSHRTRSPRGHWSRNHLKSHADITSALLSTHIRGESVKRCLTFPAQYQARHRYAHISERAGTSGKNSSFLLVRTRLELWCVTTHGGHARLLAENTLRNLPWTFQVIGFTRVFFFLHH